MYERIGSIKVIVSRPRGIYKLTLLLLSLFLYTRGMDGICGVGVDIVETSRVRGIRFLERFLELALTTHEREQLRVRTDPVAFIASRFAAKEAVVKAFPFPLSLQDFEIRKNGVRPYVHFFNPLHQVYRVHVSLAHSTEFASGYAIVEQL